MRTLIANLGSTSFKYKLYDIQTDAGSEVLLAAGGADRIGEGGNAGQWFVDHAGKKAKGTAAFADHAAAIDLHLHELVQRGVLKSLDQLDAIGFKAVHGGPISGAVVVDDDVIATMERFADVAPAHNPPYIAAMKAFATRLPHVPQVAAFETAFHQTIPASRQTYGIPHEWTRDLGIRRYGFHGASHSFVAWRMKQLMPRVRRIINCHLGGSSSLCAICDGQSVATTMGLTPQSGLPQSGRVGDFEIFALLKLRAAGIDTDVVLDRLGRDSGLLGISGVSGDMRDIRAAANAGNARAQLAIDVFVESVRHYVGAYMAVLHGAEAICFTGGIGQNNADIRAAVVAGLGFAGVKLDDRRNSAVKPDTEVAIHHAAESRVAVWVLPTNEELMVVRQVVEVLRSRGAKAVVKV